MSHISSASDKIESFIFFLIGFVVGILTCSLAGIILEGRQPVELSQRELDNPHNHIVGVVKSVESWQEEAFVQKLDKVNVKCYLKDRCKVSFCDGRSIVFVGLPQCNLDLQKEYVFIYSKYYTIIDVCEPKDLLKVENRYGYKLHNIHNYP